MRGQKEQMQGEIDELKLKCLMLERKLISAAKEEDRLHQVGGHGPSRGGQYTNYMNYSVTIKGGIAYTRSI